MYENIDSVVIFALISPDEIPKGLEPILLLFQGERPNH